MREELQFSPSLEPDVYCEDLSRVLLDCQPHIVHFAGHGIRSGTRKAKSSHTDRGMYIIEEANGIILSRKRGSEVIVGSELLSDFFSPSTAMKNIKVVLLNACWAAEQANDLVTVAKVPVAIGMSREIGDVAARNFAQGFYRGIKDNLPVKECLTWGIRQMKILDSGYEDVPKIYWNPEFKEYEDTFTVI